MAKNIVDQTIQFMAIGGQLDDLPKWGDPDAVNFRLEIFREELQEFLDAIEDGDLVEVADGIADMIVVLIGSLVTFVGEAKAMLILREVGLSNLSKFVNDEQGVRAIKREDGKILKGPDYWPPRIHAIVEMDEDRAEVAWENHQNDPSPKSVMVLEES